MILEFRQDGRADDAGPRGIRIPGIARYTATQVLDQNDSHSQKQGSRPEFGEH
jgi:hypothetical protein